LVEGIQLDAKVFSAFSKASNLQEKNGNSDGTLKVITLNSQQLQEFYSFHTGYRYSEEISGFEKKLDEEKDPDKRKKLMKKIDHRRSTLEYLKSLVS
jgi:hypothetical protein